MAKYLIDLSSLDAATTEQAHDALTKLRAKKANSPLEFWMPHEKQQTFLASRRPIKAFLGGNRSGKTTCGIADDVIQAIDRELVPEHLQEYKKWEPPFYCRILAPDFDYYQARIIQPKLRELLPKQALKSGGWAKSYSKEARVLELANGSFFEFMTYKQDLEQMGGSARHRIHYDEEPPEAIRKENMMRTIDWNGDEIFTMTPLLGMSWMFDIIWERRDSDPDVFVVTVDMDDNPHLSGRAKKRALSGLSDEEREARKHGRFVHFAGLIYGNDFQRSTHVIPQIEVPRAQPNGEEKLGKPLVPIYVGIDPGMQYMAAVVYAYVDQDGKIVVFHELALKDSTISVVADAIKAYNKANEFEPQSYWIDPAAKIRNNHTGRTEQFEYLMQGIKATLGQNDVMAGINVIKARLQQNPPQLIVSAECREIIREFARYRWSTPSHLPEATHKDQPVKRDDHLLDALRYLVMSRPRGPETQTTETLTRDQKLFKEDLERELRSVPKTEHGPGVFA